MKLIRLELTLIIVETNAPFRVRVPPTTTVATNRSPPPLLPSWSLFLDLEEEEWVEEERPALLEEFSPTREIDAATVSSSGSGFDDFSPRFEMSDGLSFSFR